MWDYLNSNSQLPGLEGVGIVISAIALIALVGAHWPRRLPGVPERATDLGRISSWMTVIAGPLLAVTALVAASWLAVPIERPLTLILHSRIRPVDADATDALMSPNSTDVCDLGPTVDQALQSYQDAGAKNWVAGSDEERGRAAEILREYLQTQPHVLPADSKTVARQVEGLPTWLVEDVEVSLVRWICRTSNVKAVRIAPGRTASDRYGWPAAAKLLTRTRCPVTIHQPLNAVSLSVRQLAHARLGPIDSNGLRQLEFWAMVEGPSTGTEIPLEIIVDGQPKPQFKLKVRADSGLYRVIAFKELLSASLFSGSDRHVADTGRTVSTTIHETLPTDGKFSLNVQGSHGAAWGNALKIVTRNPEFASLLTNITASGLPLPEDVPNAKKFTLLADDRWLVIALNAAYAESARRKIQSAMSAKVKPASTSPAFAQRIFRAPSGGSIYSWKSLPIEPGEKTLALGKTANARSIVRARTPIGEFAGTRARQKYDEAHGHSVVSVCGAGKERAVVIDLGTNYTQVLPDASESGPYDPVLFGAVVRSICWGADAVLRGQDDENLVAPPVSSAMASPLLPEDDLDAVIEASTLTTRCRLMGFVGVYLAIVTVLAAFQKARLASSQSLGRGV